MPNALFVNMRAAAVGGARVAPYLLEGDGEAAKPAMTALSDAVAARRVQDRRVVFGVHGFNVSYDKGLRSLARLGARLALPEPMLFVGVLWPGDFWIPAVNYPWEWQDAVACGQDLAAFANTTLRGATDFSFVSHSLGGRLVLEAVEGLGKPADQVCLTAPATDDDCLESPYDDAVRNARRVTYLASKRDKVLRVAYRAGDWIGDVVFGDTDEPGSGALGWHGARWPRTNRPTVDGVRIAKARNYDHGDYFPSGKPGEAITPKQDLVAAFAAGFLQGRLPIDPTPFA